MACSACSGSGPSTQVVDQIFKKVDSNRDDKITKKELTQALESDTVKLSSKDAAAKVDEVFKQLDPGNQGYISKQEVSGSPDKLAAAVGPGPGPPPGPPPGGGKVRDRDGDGGGGGGSVASYDPADTNQNGTVSSSEEVAYALKQYAASSATQTASVSYSG